MNIALRERDFDTRLGKRLEDRKAQLAADLKPVRDVSEETTQFKIK